MKDPMENMNKDKTVTNKEDWEKVYDEMKKYPHNNDQTGWICPKCGVVNAPWVTQCSCRNNYYWPRRGPAPMPYYYDWC